MSRLGANIDESGTIVRGFEGGGGICVANHTSPIDVVVLAVDNCYDMVKYFLNLFLVLFCVTASLPFCCQLACYVFALLLN